MGPNMEGVVTEADVRAAQVTLDAFVQGWQEDPRRLDGDEDAGQLLGLFLPLRGILAGQFAQVRTAGYLAGEQAGRRQVGYLVLDALAGEGLVLSFVAPRPQEGW